MSDHADYLGATQIACVTGKSLRTVRRWIKDGVLASVKVGGSRLVARAELERVLAPTWELDEEESEKDQPC